MKSIVFFNHAHSGDLFTTRGLVSDIQRQLPDYNYSYLHYSDPATLLDLIPTHSPEECKAVLSQIDLHSRLIIAPDTLFINTWVGAYSWLWHPYPHPSYIRHLLMYEQCYLDVNDNFGTNLVLDPNVWNYIPDINYSVYNTTIVDNLLSSGKKVHLICNGSVRSKQSSMGDMKNIIEILANKYPNDIFVVTAAFDTKASNIVFTDYLFNKPCDICEISYLSSKIDVIVGKNSGPFSYTNTRKNLQNPEKYFICFSHNPEDTLPYGLEISSNFIFSDTTEDVVAIDIIEKAINKYVFN